MLQEQKTYWQPFTNETPQTRQKIQKLNKKSIQMIQRPCQLIDLKLPSFPTIPSIPQFHPFPQSFALLPKSKYQNLKIDSKYLFYAKSLRYIYFLVDNQNTKVKKLFIQLYEKLIPKQEKPYLNVCKIRNGDVKELEKNVCGMIQSGLEVRVLVSMNVGRDVVKKLIDLSQTHPLITQLLIQTPLSESRSSLSSNSFLPHKIKQIHESLHQRLQQQIKIKIIKSTAKNIKPQYNFINLNSNSSELFNRKKIIQECIKGKKIQEIIQVHEQFMTMIGQYQNQRLLEEIVQCQERVGFGNKIGVLRQKIKKIQQQEQVFCKKFQDYLLQVQQNEQRMQQTRSSLNQRMFFQLIREYKCQHSIYDILNTNIRLSMTVNQGQIKKLSTIIKYLYEAIRYFYKKQINQSLTSTNKQLKYEHVYRGARVSDEELETLKKGNIVKNLGFLSTSTNQRMARMFMGENNSCLIVIMMNRDYLTQEYVNDLEGFIKITEVYRKIGVLSSVQKQFLEQQQVLFSPLNIFQVVETTINSGTRTNPHKILLKYAPHIQILSKLQKNMHNPSQLQHLQKRYEQIKIHISKLDQKNYDLGRIFEQRGQNIKALQFYDKLQSKAEKLTIQQKQTKINILMNMKQYQKVESQLKQSINSLAKIKEQINNKEKNKEKITKSQRIQIITSMGKMTEILQKTENYASTQKEAENLEKEVKKLKENIAGDKEITTKQLFSCLKADLKSSVLLAKSKLENNDVKISMKQIHRSFNLVDQIYSSLQKFQIPQLCNSVLSLPDQRKYTTLKHTFKQFNLEPLPKKSLAETLKQAQTKKIQVSQKTNISEIKDKIDNYIDTDKSVSDRKNKQKIYKLYNALCEKDILLTYSADLKSTMNSLGELKESIESLLVVEDQIHNCYKAGLKATNLNINKCVKSQRKVIETRFGKFERQLQQKLKQKVQNEVNPKIVKQYSEINQFLLEYQLFDPNKAIQTLRDTIKSSLSSSPNKSPTQKTILLQSDIKEVERSTNDDSILQKISIQNQNINNDKQKIKLLTISSQKSKQKFSKHLSKLKQMLELHKKNDQINQCYYNLKDLNQEVQLYVSSAGIADGTEGFQYREWLRVSNGMIEQFKEKYQKMKESEELARLYYLLAEVKLKLGYFKQAKASLQQSSKILTIIYEEDTNKDNNKPRQTIFQKLTKNSLSKTFARDPVIKCYKLKAQIIGVYDSPEDRTKYLQQLIKMKQFVKSKAPDKIITEALINEAVGFLASRCIPDNVKSKSVYFRQVAASYQRSIQLRSSQIGDENQFAAVAICIIAQVQFKKDEKNREIRELCKKGLDIFKQLQKVIPLDPKTTYLQRQPMLYLYYMKLKYISGKIDNRVSLDTFVQNIKEFQSRRREQKSLYIAEIMYDAGKILSKDEKYKKQGEEYLQRCEKQMQKIGQMNQLDVSQSLTFSKFKQSLYEVICSISSQKKAIYSQKLKSIKNQIKKLWIQFQKVNKKPQPQPQPPMRRSSGYRNMIRDMNIFQYTLHRLMQCTGNGY